MINNITINVQKNQPIVLIDGGYYVFYRYFATKSWFAFQKKEFNVDSITDNKEFIDSFIKHMENDIKKICKKWKTNINNIVFCTDCQRSKIWRNDIYDAYKGSRVQNVNFNSKIFNIFNDYIMNNNIKKISFDRLEADDVIFLMQSKLKKLKENIVIITNDNDYLQMVSENVSIFNMQLKDITLRGNQNAKVDLYYKTIYGDKSDNIPKISSSITKDKAIYLSNLSEFELQKYLKENNLIEKFDFNMNLISFDKIPTSLVENFNKKYVISVI